MSGPAAGVDRAWGWVAHLRSGGTTPWSAWQGGAPAEGRLLPGAQQLELLRRINLASPESPDVAIAGRVLTAAASGRGKPDLPLAGVSDSAWGSRPVTPEELRPAALIRVATTLLAEDLVAARTAPEREPLRRPWLGRRRLIGDPLVVGGLESSLRAQGRALGGPHARVVVIAGPLDELLAHTWTRLCFEHGTMRWPDWLRHWRGRNELPPRVDLARATARSSQRPHQVRIVTDHSRLAREVGIRHLPDLPIPGADAAELARRVAPLVGLMAPADQRPAIMAGMLGAHVARTGVAGVDVPASERAWIERSAERVQRDLKRAGYPVLGDLTSLTPRFNTHEALDRQGLDQQVLDLAVRMLVDGTLTMTTGRSTR